MNTVLPKQVVEGLKCTRNIILNRDFFFHHEKPQMVCTLLNSVQQ